MKVALTVSLLVDEMVEYLVASSVEMMVYWLAGLKAVYLVESSVEMLVFW